MAAVTGHGLSKRFGERTALAEVSFAIAAGGVLLVLGPSGAGKTTLLRLVAGVEEPDAGSVTIAGRRVAGEGCRVPPHERGVAFLFQRPTLWPHMTAQDNVALALVGRGLRRRERRARAAEALGKRGMAGHLRAYPATLSGGELQRVSLARALVTEPRVLLLDEPLTSLDVTLRGELVRELAALRSAGGVTILWVSHRDEEALGLADGLLLLRGGAVVESGEPEAVLARPRSVFGARFLGDANILKGRVTAGGRVETVLGELGCPPGGLPVEPAKGGVRRPGEAVLLAVPPDGFRVLTAGGLSGNGAVRGQVVKVEFRGRYFAHWVRIARDPSAGALGASSAEEETVRVYLPERLSLGDVVALGLRAAPTVVEEE